MERGWWSIADFLGRWIIPLILLVSVIGVAFGAYELSREMAAQRGIDAHGQRVTGTLTRGSVGIGLYARERSTVDFTVGGRQVTTGVHGIPADVGSGESVCLEVDAERPIWARLCGTRGGLDDAQRELLIAGASVAGSGALWVLYQWRRRIDRRRSLHPLAA
jgi:hypothetical protein